jgi:hypothetical protein
MNEKLVEVIHTADSQSQFMKTLAYKSIDAEARSRRNNLIFSCVRGFVENKGENCTSLILDFIENRLTIRSNDVRIARAQRLGMKDRSKHTQRRPIIVNFTEFCCHVEIIMKNVTLLKNTGFSIGYDFD